MLRNPSIKVLLVHILVAGTVVLGAGCAGAKVGNIGNQPDSGTADGASYGSCDPFSKTVCPATMKCTALQNGGSFSTGCGSKGLKVSGDACQATGAGTAQTGDDCGGGLACFTVQGLDTGPTCHQLCSPTGAGTACPTGFACGSDDVLPGQPTVAFCRVSCQPLEQSGCAGGQGCYLTSAGSVCSPAGTGNPGDACVNANDCKPGSTCLLTTASSWNCLYFCSTAPGGTPACSGSATGGTTCKPLPGTVPEPNAGVCR